MVAGAHENSGAVENNSKVAFYNVLVPSFILVKKDQVKGTLYSRLLFHLQKSSSLIYCILLRGSSTPPINHDFSLPRVTDFINDAGSSARCADFIGAARRGACSHGSRVVNCAAPLLRSRFNRFYRFNRDIRWLFAVQVNRVRMLPVLLDLLKVRPHLCTTCLLTYELTELTHSMTPGYINFYFN